MRRGTYPVALRLKHGRLTDERWGELWDSRLIATQQRVQTLLDNSA